MTVHVFHGPTITRDEVAAILPAARTHAPIRHGDLLALADRGPGDTVVIIDGVFHATPPVRHKEILLLLAEGIAVVGASSMGALRAAELHRYGMTGIGRVFEMYRDGTIEADDEVAVAHTPDDHRPLSVALVSIRVELSEAGSTGVLKESEAGRLLAMARELPYQRRTWAALRRAGTQAGDPELADAVARLTDWQLTRPATDAKHADALQALTAVARGDVTPPDPSPWAHLVAHGPREAVDDSLPPPGPGRPRPPGRRAPAPAALRPRLPSPLAPSRPRLDSGRDTGANVRSREHPGVRTRHRRTGPGS